MKMKRMSGSGLNNITYDELLVVEPNLKEFKNTIMTNQIYQHDRERNEPRCNDENKQLTDLLRIAGNSLEPTNPCNINCHLRKPVTADMNPATLYIPKSRRASSALREAFPRAIAEAIMEGRRPEPIVRDCVSVFFSDIVGFTSISSTMDAARVSSLLTRLFAKLDALAQLHGVQKVDVIGDAYLAATNILEDQAADHAARLARFALDAVTAAAATRLDDADPASPAVQIRVGIHSGPVSATVVGAQGFKYTIFGDTVNTASRMESTSLPGRVQCSAEAAALIARQDPQVPLAAREGGVQAKGKGRMHTCWVGQAACRPPPLGRFGSFGRARLEPAAPCSGAHRSWSEPPSSPAAEGALGWRLRSQWQWPGRGGVMSILFGGAAIPQR